MSVSLAQVMQSTNYKIQSDSINVGGGFSSSSNYVSQSTFGEIATGYSSSTNYGLRAGYQQMQEVYIAISNAPNVVLSPSISGITGGTSNGSTTVTVTTDSSAGYSLTIFASTNPAMQKGSDVIADYIPAGAPPDFTFITGSTQALLGFTPEGINVVQRFKDNGSVCNAGSANVTLACWDRLSTTPQSIAEGSSSNHPQGAATTLRFRVGIGSAVVQPEGIYTATTTLTALAL
jgi:hypothetical protein